MLKSKPPPTLPTSQRRRREHGHLTRFCPSPTHGACAARHGTTPSFKRDRLKAAVAKLAERVEALPALEADRHARAEHARILAERARNSQPRSSAAAEPIPAIARLLTKIERFDHEIRCYNLRPTRLSNIPPVISGRGSSIMKNVSSDGPVRGVFVDLVAREIHKGVAARS